MRLVKIGLTLLSSVSMIAISTSSTLAQDTSSEDTFAVEEILVTARRRTESLTDVPGTVTALTETALESAGVQRAEDFIKLTPGVSMVNAAEAGDTQVNIRGINGARDAENSFAFILDGILYTNPAAFNREYTNLKQIEIFKGPQGAIYGRNAAAGAIIVNTAKPDGETDIRGTVSFAEDNTYLMKASASGALTDNAFFRISGDWRQSDGFYRNTYQDDAAIVDAFESHNINARLVFDPSDDLSIDMKMRYGQIDASSITFNSTFKLPVFAEAFANPAANQDVNEYDFQFDANNVSDNDQKSFEASAKFDYGMDGMTLTGWLLYSKINNNLMSDGTSAAFGFYNSDPVCAGSAADLTGYPLLAPQFLGLNPTLPASPVGILFTPDFSGSFLGAYTPTTCDGIQEQVRNQKDISAELRLASDNDSDLQWMVGAYFLDIDRQVGVSLNRDSGSTLRRGLYQATGDNATASLTYDDFDSRVFAVFGQMQYDMTEDFQLSVAVRYDNEKRESSSLVDPDARQTVIDTNGDGFLDGNDTLNPGLNATGSIADKEATFSEFEPKISLTYDASDDITLFASWGVGFKAGGFNNSGSAATVGGGINYFINGLFGTSYADNMGVPLPLIADDYKKETSSAFEAGFKGSILDGRIQLNAAGYYTKVTDMQFFEFFVGTFGLLRVVSNIDQVDIKGVEFGATVHASSHLRFYGGANFVDSEIKANSSRPDTVGNKSPYTPDYTLNIGGDFDIPVNDTISIVGRVDARFVGATWFHTVQEGQRPTIFMPLFGISPVTGVFDNPDLGIADYSGAQRDSYHTIDARLGLQADSWSITAYATNLTNQRILEEVIPAPEFGGTFDHPGAMRRFGVELGFKF